MTRPEETRVADLVRALLGGERRDLRLADAMAMACAARRAATAANLRIVVAVVDAAGNPIVLERMDDSLPASLTIAVDKAFTAAMFRTSTRDLGRSTVPGGPLWGLATTLAGRVCVVGGGFPCIAGGRVIGAIGVSGGTVEEDEAIARAALDVFANDPEPGSEGGHHE